MPTLTTIKCNRPYCEGNIMFPQDGDEDRRAYCLNCTRVYRKGGYVRKLVEISRYDREAYHGRGKDWKC